MSISTISSTWVAAVAMFVSGCGAEVRYIEIPQNYIGWVRVTRDENCATVNRTRAGTVIQVRSDGRACVMAQPAPKSFYRHFYYVDATGRRVRELRATGWGKGGEIWAEMGGDEYRFFVGTEQQLRAAWRGKQSAQQLPTAPKPER